MSPKLAERDDVAHLVPRLEDQAWRIAGVRRAQSLRQKPSYPEVFQAPSVLRARMAKLMPFRYQHGALAGLDGALHRPKIGRDLSRQRFQVARAEHTRCGPGIGEVERRDKLSVLVQRAPGHDRVAIVHGHGVEALAQYKDVCHDIARAPCDRNVAARARIGIGGPKAD